MTGEKFLLKLTLSLSFSTSQITPRAFESGMGSAPIVTSLILGARSHCGISVGISVGIALAHESEIHFLSLNPRLLKSAVDSRANLSVQTRNR